MTILVGDCVEVMADMEPDSIDAIVTDPPYGLEFMGKEWDRLDAGLPQENVWKGRRGGGSFAKKANVAFKGEVRGPSFGGDPQGFKRCQTCGKRAFSGSPCQCPEPDYVTEYNYGPSSQSLRMGRWHQRWATEALRVAKPGAYLLAFGGTRTVHRLMVALEDAGWIIRDLLVWAYASGFPKSKASLKPAWEPIVMARKPGPLRMLDIDGCRIGFESDDDLATAQQKNPGKDDETVTSDVNGADRPQQSVTPAGRWPANVVLTDPIFDGDTEGVVGGGETASTYSRFFLIPKASRSDREPLVPGETTLDGGVWGGDEDDLSEGKKRTIPRQNTHPTVKPTRLMRHLVRLVTPQGGTVLDPFLGSGTTALAAEAEGFDWVGIEREAEYARVAEQRLELAQRGLGL